MQPAMPSAKARRSRVRYSNRIKCLLCYLICFSLPLLWQAAALVLIYPYKLAGTAPNIAANLMQAFPFLAPFLTSAAQAAVSPVDGTSAALLQALSFRENAWLWSVGASLFSAWAITLVLQLIWRCTHARVVLAARAAASAIHAYRLAQTVIWLVNALFACALWFLGVRFIAGKTLWDYLAYFLAYALTPLAAFVCFRLAAPPALSGKHGFFKRL